MVLDKGFHCVPAAPSLGHRHHSHSYHCHSIHCKITIYLIPPIPSISGPNDLIVIVIIVTVIIDSHLFSKMSPSHSAFDIHFNICFNIYLRKRKNPKFLMPLFNTMFPVPAQSIIFSISGHLFEAARPRFFQSGR